MILQCCYCTPNEVFRISDLRLLSDKKEARWQVVTGEGVGRYNSRKEKAEFMGFGLPYIAKYYYFIYRAVSAS